MGKALDLHVSNISSIPSIPSGPLSPTTGDPSKQSKEKTLSTSRSGPHNKEIQYQTPKRKHHFKPSASHANHLSSTSGTKYDALALHMVPRTRSSHQATPDVAQTNPPQKDNNKISIEWTTDFSVYDLVKKIVYFLPRAFWLFFNHRILGNFFPFWFWEHTQQCLELISGCALGSLRDHMGRQAETQSGSAKNKASTLYAFLLLQS